MIYYTIDGKVSVLLQARDGLVWTNQNQLNNSVCFVQKIMPDS